MAAPPRSEDEPIHRSAAVLEAAGCQLLPLAHAIGPWPLVGVTPAGLILCAVVAEAWPADLGIRYGPLSGWPPTTRRLLHHWRPDAPWPVVLAL